MSRAIHELLTVIWLRVKVPVLSVASSVSWAIGQQKWKNGSSKNGITDPVKIVQSLQKDISYIFDVPSVSTPCRSLTRTFCLAIRFAAIDKSNVTTEGRPSGTNATKTETANVTVCAALPAYTVVIPTAKKTMAKRIAMQETITTNRELFLVRSYNSRK